MLSEIHNERLFLASIEMLRQYRQMSVFFIFATLHGLAVCTLFNLSRTSRFFHKVDRVENDWHIDVET